MDDILASFLKRHVVVHADPYRVDGTLLKMDRGEHGELGNLVLSQGNQLMVVKGSEVQTIATR